MSTRLTVEEIIEAAKRLAPGDRRRLVEALSSDAPARNRHITELRGLGKEIWKDQDAQEYVDSERDSWRN